MNNYIFKDKNGKNYKRIDKRQAKRLYDAGETVIFCPCNMRPFGFYNPQIEINKNDIIADNGAPLIYADGTRENDFKYIVNSFEFYNCNNTETGKYTAFYACIKQGGNNEKINFKSKNALS